MNSDFDFDNKLYVSQIIPTIQGEGPLIGYPSLLIRLGGCNLRCKWCDTKYTWPPINHEVYTEFHVLRKTVDKFFNNYTIKNIMFTGGEPFLYTHNDIFIDILEYFIDNWNLTTEIETNGSLLNFTGMNPLLKKMIYENVISLNISPKLNRLFYKNETEYDLMVSNLKSFINIANSKDMHNYNFKFVHETDDSIYTFLKEFNRDDLTDIYVMPHTPDRKTFNSKSEFLEAYNKKALKTVAFCMKNGFIYCPRTHLYLFDSENETF